MPFYIWFGCILEVCGNCSQASVNVTLVKECEHSLCICLSFCVYFYVETCMSAEEKMNQLVKPSKVMSPLLCDGPLAALQLLY